MSPCELLEGALTLGSSRAQGIRSQGRFEGLNDCTGREAEDSGPCKRETTTGSSTDVCVFILHGCTVVFLLATAALIYLGAEEISISPAGRSLRWWERLKDTKSKTRMVSFDLPPDRDKGSDTCHCGSELLNLPDVVNDLDVDLAIDPVAAAAYLNDQRNLRKIREHTAKLQLNIINPPRPGKRLLVLDIDYSETSVVLALIFTMFT